MTKKTSSTVAAAYYRCLTELIFEHDKHIALNHLAQSI